MRAQVGIVALVVSTVGFVSGVDIAQAKNDKVQYRVQVARTSYGIPHVQAQDWGSLGYGYGYAFAQDNACVLAADLLVATGTRSRYFGPGTNNSNLISDWVYAMVNADARVNPAWDSLDTDTRQLLTGYADGYNRHLRDKGSSGLAPDCRGAAWVRPLTGLDVYRMLRKLMVQAGTGNFTSSLVGAAPPAVSVARASGGASGSVAKAVVEQVAEAGQPIDAERARRLLDAVELPDFGAERFGSNAVALGSELTGGSGALLGNPHFPWFGIGRFYAVHLTIPGRYDVMGASIYGFPLVNIGFNRHLAWSHTVSTARRFVVRELTLVPGNPTSYLNDGRAVAMRPEVVTADVLVGGSVVPVSHTFYMTQFGPVLVIPPLALWSATKAYALTDINLENTRPFRQYREMGTARNLDEFAQALRTNVGLPWVNTIAADSRGGAFYADIGAIPNVTNATLAVCANTPVAQALSSARIYTLDGSISACDPGTDADAPEAGIFGAGNLPSLVRSDYVQNSNDSYWLANPGARLEGYSRIIGADENRPQGFRTRLGITQIHDRMNGTDGLSGSGFDRQWLQDVLFANRHYSPEIMLDGVLTLCAEESHLVDVGGVIVDVTEACDVLAAWDRRNTTASVGPHVWTEFWTRAQNAPNLYAVPFDPADPVNTPRNVNLGNAALRARLMGDLGRAVKFLADNGIPVNVAWGRLHFDTRNGEAIPIHGGSGPSGVYNAIVPAGLVPGVGYTPIAYGSSYIQAVTFTPSGPDARAIVTYSESTNPESPHYADMTRLFSGYGWVNMPFDEGAIRRDPTLTVITLSERR